LGENCPNCRKKGGKCLKILKIWEKMLNFLPKLKSGKKETSGLGNSESCWVIAYNQATLCGG
jgi:hypothetical protein